jgi:hypothetical protein
MSDQDLIASLRAAADRIEALIAERDAWKARYESDICPVEFVGASDDLYLARTLKNLDRNSKLIVVNEVVHGDDHAA